jgi:hypothetical protein
MLPSSPGVDTWVRVDLFLQQDDVGGKDHARRSRVEVMVAECSLENIVVLAYQPKLVKVMKYSVQAE